MNFLQALNQTYIEAEKGGMVDKPVTAASPVTLLPVYHDRKHSTGFDIVNVIMDENGEIVELAFVPENEYVVFPVSESSIGRSSGVSPHPLVDKLMYLSPTFSSEHHKKYLDQLLEWKSWADQNDPQLILDLVLNYLINHDLYEEILDQLSKTYQIERGTDGDTLAWQEDKKKRSKKIKFAELFVTFEIEHEDSRKRNTNITENIILHNNHIAHTEYLLKDKEKSICSISGEYTYCVSKHPGLLGNAKIISISNHSEVHYGRFGKPEDLFIIGFRTSQQIHLMLQYLLTNPDNNVWLGAQQYLVNWFSNDISNENKFFPTNAFAAENQTKEIVPESSDISAKEDENEQQTGLTTLGGNFALGLGKHITGKQQNDHDFSNYYIMIVEKTSNGRVAVKYFRSYRQAELESNVSYWYQTASWPYPSKSGKGTVMKAPSPYNIVTTIYGEEDKDRIQMNGKKLENLRSSLVADLIPCVIERKPIPAALAKKAFNQSKNRSSYKKTWPQYLRMTLCVLTKHFKDIGHIKKEEENYMLDEQNLNRSYLYGRLLAIYDRIETDADYFSNRKDDEVADKKSESTNDETKSGSTRSTNAQRLWTAFTASPSSIHLILRNKVQVYLERLRNKNSRRASYLERTLQDVIMKIEEAQKEESNPNKPLDESFLFGYYGQTQAFYARKKNEQEQ